MAIAFWDPVPTTAEGPLFPEDPWDVCILGGEFLPGVVTVRGAPMLSFDKKKAGGVDGATITVNGYLPGPVEIDLLMWTSAQWVHFQAIAPNIWRRPNKKTKASALAVSISHPAFDIWGISQVVVLGVSPPEKGPIEGSRVVKFKCVEYVAQASVSHTKTAKPGAVVPLAKEYDPARNRAGDPPSKTDIEPGGPPKTKKGGVD
jgi:hypothetical protein